MLELMAGQLDDAIVYRDRDSIDISIELPALNLVVAIENKIRAEAGDGQLEADPPGRSLPVVAVIDELGPLAGSIRG